jgi:putative alpha-1,2-mannosidase
MYNGAKPFVIKAKNNSEDNIYIQSATLNGIPLTVPKVKFKEIVKGGELIFIMGNKPNEGWGVAY